MKYLSLSCPPQGTSILSNYILYINICNGYTMGTSALPDIYAPAGGPRASVHISGKARVPMHGITNMFYYKK